jgi:hypothetical protein
LGGERGKHRELFHKIKSGLAEVKALLLRKSGLPDLAFSGHHFAL